MAKLCDNCGKPVTVSQRMGILHMVTADALRCREAKYARRPA